MIRSLTNQFFVSLATLAAVLFLTFLLLHTIPGGPFDQERELPPEIKKNLFEKYGLHERGEEGFWSWVSKDLSSYVHTLARRNLGPSLKYKERDVGEIIAGAVGPSATLGIYALIVSFSLGLLFGILSVKKPGSTIDRAIIFFSSFGVALPSFVAATLLILIFATILKMFPPALWEGARYTILPVATLSLAPLAYFAQLTRSVLLEVLSADYIRTAMAKGVSWFRVVIKHALKNAATPLLTVLGPIAANLVTGSFIVETVFAVPGLGRHFVTAVIDRDTFLVMGITLVYAALLIFLNWMVDIGYLLLDPRMREKKAKS